MGTVGVILIGVQVPHIKKKKIIFIAYKRIFKNA